MMRRRTHASFLSWLARWACVCLLAAIAGRHVEAQPDRTGSEPAVDTADPADAVEQADPEQPAARDTPDPPGEQDGTGVGLPLEPVIELASAYRLRDELSAMLADDGQAEAGADRADENRLAGLATRCAVLANSTESDQARAILLACQARANAALAQLEAAGPKQTRQRRIEQIRSAAEKIRALDVPAAQASADYWVLLADIAEDAQTDASAEARQTLAEQLLMGYLDQHAQATDGREFVVDALLSLAHLLNERGDQAGVIKQLEAIGELPEDSPRRPEADRLLASAQRIGRSLALEGVTTRLKLWRLSDHADQPVLIHIYADAVEPSVDMIDQITQVISTNALGGSRVVSLRIGEAIADTHAAPWPTIPIGLEPGGVIDRLGIEALPTLVWIDHQGKVAAIGHSAAVLDQMPTRADQTQEGDAEAAVDTEQADPPSDGSDAGVSDDEAGEVSESE